MLEKSYLSSLDLNMDAYLIIRKLSDSIYKNANLNLTNAISLSVSVVLRQLDGSRLRQLHKFGSVRRPKLVGNIVLTDPSNVLDLELRRATTRSS